MKINIRILALIAVAALALSTASCDRLKARDQLNKGVASYKNARYEQAVEHFKNAVTLDPSLSNAKIYLAAAYVAQYIPGVESPENLQNANNAIAQYKAVLDKDPKNVNSVKSLAGLYFQMKKFDDAKTYNQRAVELDPNDPEAYYSIGVIDYWKLFTPLQEEKSKAGLRADEPLKDKKLCASLRDKDSGTLQEGLDSLNKAMSLRQDYDDAMAYMNLLYRQKADRECDQPDQAAQDRKAADDWLDKAMAARKEKAEKAASAPQGITNDQSQ
ncbi:MAG TPA: tetratricopeptide repeat protein [Terriglobales bacterium]|nr:tetratricopeptide repeat protein [Terriglobales bacterium]